MSITLVALVACVVVAPSAAAQPRAARALPRGHVLTAEDIAHGAGPSTPDTRHPTPGWVTKRVVAAGEPLRAPAVAPPDVVAAGQPVDVLWTDGAIRLRLKGTAANAAPLGARVVVRIDARRRLEGVAAAPGVVRLR